MPLKIVHVANFSLVPKGAGYSSVHYKLSNGLVRLGHRVIDFGDRDIARASTLIRARAWGSRSANRKLLRLCDDFRPDAILFGHADVIGIETIAEIRRLYPGVRLAQWNVDALFTPANVERIVNRAEVIDHSFVTTAGPMLEELRARIGNAWFLPNPVDPSIETGRAFEIEQPACDVFMAVGNGTVTRSHCGIQTTAIDFVARLRTRLPGIRCTAPGVDGLPVFGARYDEAIRHCAIGINFSRRNDVSLYSSDRLAQIVGNGLVAMIDRGTGYDTLFRDDEMAFYSSEDELFAQISHLLDRPAERMRMARRGWTAYRATFDCTRVADFMIGTVTGRLDPGSFDWSAVLIPHRG